MYNKKIFKKCISLLSVLAIMLCSLSTGYMAFGDDLVAINDTSFSDKNFRKIISEVYDIDENGYLDTKERSKTMLSLSIYLEDICGKDAKIESLKGIEFFPNLTKLYASALGLKTLDVSQNTKLQYLACNSNELTELKLGYLPNLTRLECAANVVLDSIDVSRCPNLQQLQCYSNSISSLNVSSNPNLVLLYTQQNKLSTLDVSRNTNLQELYCSNNNIRELDLSANTQLNETTVDMIGDQWIDGEAVLRQNKINISYSFNNPLKLVSSSLDTIVETEDGNAVASAYTGSAFIINEVSSIKDHLINPDKERIDGFVYKYSVGNSACEDMTVNVAVTRDFYQVNFYLDEAHTARISYALVPAGSSANAPAVPDAPTCKRFVNWSEDYTNVNDDLDVYIVWADDHNIVNEFAKNMANGYIDIRCTKCDTKTISFNFMAAYNSKEGDDNFVEIGDANNDGVINAKDYIIFKNIK